MIKPKDFTVIVSHQLSQFFEGLVAEQPPFHMDLIIVKFIFAVLQDVHKVPIDGGFTSSC